MICQVQRLVRPDEELLMGVEVIAVLAFCVCVI